jgi:hypothetical protein
MLFVVYGWHHLCVICVRMCDKRTQNSRIKGNDFNALRISDGRLCVICVQMYTPPPSKLLRGVVVLSLLKFFFDTLTFTVGGGGMCTNGHKTHTIEHTSKFSLLKSTTYAREPSENHTQITHNRPQTVPTVHAQPAHKRPQPATNHTQPNTQKPWTNGHKHVRMATNHTQPHTPSHKSLTLTLPLTCFINHQPTHQEAITILNPSSNFILSTSINLNHY